MRLTYLAISMAIIAIAALYFLTAKTGYVTAGNLVIHLRGSDNARIVIEQFSDFGCTECVSVEAAVQDVLRNYIGQVKLIYKHYPKTEVAERAAEAAECASEQGRFWDYHDVVLASQNISAQSLIDYAVKLSLNATQFNECLKDGAVSIRIKTDVEDGKQRGVISPPTFFINGQPLRGDQPYFRFKQIIESELGIS